jgi:hypothetical protein
MTSLTIEQIQKTIKTFEGELLQYHPVCQSQLPIYRQLLSTMQRENFAYENIESQRQTAVAMGKKLVIMREALQDIANGTSRSMTVAREALDSIGEEPNG